MRQEKNIDGTAKYSSYEVRYKALLSMANETVLTTMMGGNLLKRSNKILKGNRPVYKKFAELPIDLCIKLDASMDLVNSRSEFFTYSTFNSRIKSMNVALNTLNIKQCFSLDASNEVKYLTDASLARVFSLNG